MTIPDMPFHTIELIQRMAANSSTHHTVDTLRYLLKIGKSHSDVEPILMASGSSVKTTQELMRHATADITLEVYAQAVTDDKQEAQSVFAALSVGQRIPVMQRAKQAFPPN